jgi:uncharacterized membrane protein
MTAQEAIEESPDNVARAKADGGLISIARSPDGYQLSFLPRTSEGIWNLAGTIAVGSYASAEEAADTAWTQCGADPTSWEAAPENIIGSETAASLAPTVDGRHLRHHGAPEQQGMRATFLGHPLHPQLILLPAGLLPYSFLMDVLHHATGKQSYAAAAYHTMWGGVAGGLAAGAAGAVDYLSIKDESPSKPIASLHAAMNIGMMALYGVNLMTRRNVNRTPGLLSTVLSGIGAAGLLVSAWYGAHLVYDHGMRVRGVDELANARDAAPPGDARAKETLEHLPSMLPG